MQSEFLCKQETTRKAIDSKLEVVSVSVGWAPNSEIHFGCCAISGS